MIFNYNGYEYEPASDVLHDALVDIVEEQICKNVPNLDKMQKLQLSRNIDEFLGNLCLATYNKMLEDYEDELKDNLENLAMEDYRDSLYDEGDPYASQHL